MAMRAPRPGSIAVQGSSLSETQLFLDASQMKPEAHNDVHAEDVGAHPSQLKEKQAKTHHITVAQSVTYALSLCVLSLCAFARTQPGVLGKCMEDGEAMRRLNLVV